ncbi:MAG TPA: dipicolinate synthase subunit DpsA [Firmicutes bacterium]|nr:dipicolinate synthase subunit DpsA [Bacillota bacterium]
MTLLAGTEIAIVGGDAREACLAEELLVLGAEVWLYGFSRPVKKLASGVRAGLPQRADVVILPLVGVGDDQAVYAPLAKKRIYLKDLQSLFLPSVLVICGKLPGAERKALEEKQVTVIETAALEEIAVLNAIPTAEGALAYAISHSPWTLFGSKILVTGFGRCAQPLARALKALGAEVTVAVRRREAAAAARAQGFGAIALSEIMQHAGSFRFVFNTVPAPVLDRKVLAAMTGDVCIVDLASQPGGVDFAAAEEFSLHAVLLPGLPGKTVPAAAGKILADVYPHYILLHKGKGGTPNEA